MKTKIIIPLILTVFALATTVMAGDFKIQNSTFSDLFKVSGADGNVTILGGISIATDGLDESAINFVTTCGTGHRLYIDGSNLACEVAGNTSEEITDLIGTMFTGNTETGISVDFQDSDDTIDFVISPTYWNSSDSLDDDELAESKIAFSTVCAAGNHLYISGNDLACEADADTTYDNATGISLVGTTFSLADSCSPDEVLKWDGDTWNCSSDVGGTGLNDIVEDTTPQLGGNLDLNNFAVDSGDGTTNMTIDATNNFIIVLATS